MQLKGASVKQAKEKTYVEFSTDFFSGRYLTIEGTGKVIFRVNYPKDNTHVKIETEREGKITEHTLKPGDSYNLHHCVNISTNKDIRKNHVFPITFKMDGQEYKLNKTKQSKLILTK